MASSAYGDGIEAVPGSPKPKRDVRVVFTVPFHGEVSLKARQTPRKRLVGFARAREVSRPSLSANWSGAGIGKQTSLETRWVNSPCTVGTCPLRQNFILKLMVRANRFEYNI